MADSIPHNFGISWFDVIFSRRRSLRTTVLSNAKRLKSLAQNRRAWFWFCAALRRDRRCYEQYFSGTGTRNIP